MLIIRNCGPVGYPGSAEVVNMQPPASMLKQGINTLPTMGDGRQSGHLGVAVDPECVAGSGGGRWAGAAEDGRSHPDRPEHAQGRCAAAAG